MQARYSKVFLIPFDLPSPSINKLIWSMSSLEFLNFGFENTSDSSSLTRILGFISNTSWILSEKESNKPGLRTLLLKVKALH